MARFKMVKYSIAAILGCLYIAGAAWVVHAQGHAYRDTLRRTRLASIPTPPPVAAPAQPPEPAPPRTTVAAANVPAPSATAINPPTDPGTKVAAANIPAPSMPAVSPAPAPAPTSSPAVPEPASSAEPPKPKNAPSAAALDPFWTSDEVKEVWDLAHLDAAGEMRLGQQLHSLVLRFNPAVQGPYLRRVKEAAAPLLEACTRKELKYTFTVVDSDAVCAFSHPGGYVYVSRGLFDMIGEDENYALTFVLAHEIAHVDLGHALKCLADPGFKAGGIGTLQAYYFFVAPLGYQDNQEYEADAWALKCMRKLDHSRYETLAFLRKFKTYAEEHGFEDGKKPPPPPGGSTDAKPDQPAASQSSADLVENHFRAHPATWERLKKLEALWPAGK